MKPIDSPMQDNTSNTSTQTESALTPNEFLRLGREDIEHLIDESFPSSAGKPSFEPELYSASSSTLLQQMKEWKREYTAKSDERKTITNWVVLSLAVAAIVLTVILTGGVTQIAALVFTLTVMAVISFYWFFGRVWRWEAKRYAENVQFAENAVEKVRNRRAKEWVTARYELPAYNVEWAEFSDFYIDGRAYRWAELEDGHFVVQLAATGEEPPQL